jgi:hypothetical protein
MTESTTPNVKDISVTLSESASQALTQLTDPALNLFDSRSDAVCQAILLISWAAVETRKGCNIGIIQEANHSFAQLSMPFIGRINGADRPVTEVAAAVSCTIALPAQYIQITDALLGWSSTKPFDDLSDLVSQSLRLLLYAVNVRREGNSLGSLGEAQRRVTEVHLPFIDRLRGK